MGGTERERDSARLDHGLEQKGRGGAARSQSGLGRRGAEAVWGGVEQERDVVARSGSGVGEPTSGSAGSGPLALAPGL